MGDLANYVVSLQEEEKAKYLPPPPSRSRSMVKFFLCNFLADYRRDYLMLPPSPSLSQQGLRPPSLCRSPRNKHFILQGGCPRGACCPRKRYCDIFICFYINAYFVFLIFDTTPIAKKLLFFLFFVFLFYISSFISRGFIS